MASEEQERGAVTKERQALLGPQCVSHVLFPKPGGGHVNGWITCYCCRNYNIMK